jgi:AraC-like DNA-binding protein
LESVILNNYPPDGGLASVPAIAQYLKAAEASGIDCLPLLASVGITAAELNDNSGHIAIDAMEQLLILLIEASDDGCFGLHAAKFVEPSSYSVLGYISLNCSTLREAQGMIPIYEKIVGDMGVTTIENKGDFVFQRWNCKFSNPLVKRHQVEHVLASWATYSKIFLKFEAPASVWFEHSPPKDKKLVVDYEAIFGCEVLFDQAGSGILLREVLLDVALPQANEQLLKTLLDHATQVMSGLSQHQTIMAKVQNLLRLTISERTPSSSAIAEQLGISGRTLQRRLDEEETSFKDVLNDLRLELAQHYLKNTDFNMDTIAAKLGYGETRSFHRSFKQWTGRTAGSFR